MSLCILATILVHNHDRLEKPERKTVSLLIYLFILLKSLDRNLMLFFELITVALAQIGSEGSLCTQWIFAFVKRHMYVQLRRK